MDPRWTESVSIARSRADGRCEQCRRPSEGWIFVYTWKTREARFGGQWRYHMVWLGLTEPGWRDQAGQEVPWRTWPHGGLPRLIRAQIGAAHLDGNPYHMEPDNCRMLCNWCHLHHDQQQHHEARADRKDRRRPILSGFA
jgi:hypothetical protein